MGKWVPPVATQRDTAPLRRNPLRPLFLMRVPVVLAILALGIVALATGHDKSGLPLILLVGVTGVLELAAWLRRRRLGQRPPD
jgi:hypothetical protein